MNKALFEVSQEVCFSKVENRVVGEHGWVRILHYLPCVADGVVGAIDALINHTLQLINQGVGRIDVFRSYYLREHSFRPRHCLSAGI